MQCCYQPAKDFGQVSGESVFLQFARLAGIDIEIPMKPSSKPALTVKTRAA